MPSPQKRTNYVSWRAILIGLLLIPINTYWIAMTEMVWSSLHFTAASLPLNVVFILLFLIFLNWFCKFIAPNFVLSQSELLVIYIILVLLGVNKHTIELTRNQHLLSQSNGM